MDQEIKEADIDEDVRADLEEKLLESEANSFEEDIAPETEPHEFSKFALFLLRAAAKQVSGEIIISKESDKYQVWFGGEDGLSHPLKGRREFLIAQEETDKLASAGYLGTNGDDWYAVTKEGYDFLESQDLLENKPSK